MDAANQQKILGYFIEEAKEHLETLERGILELSSVMEDSERVNEMFRAAHSIKGGAAMLGYGSIQKTAHRLEDAFKILKDQTIAVDRNLESLFLSGYDVLQDLVEHLQSPMGLQPEEADAIVLRAEPKFVELQDYLKQLLGGAVTLDREEEPVIRTAPRVSLAPQVKNALMQMLQLFKQQDNPVTRQQLQKACVSLAQLSPAEQGWQKLLKAAQTALANPKHPYRVLAPVIIKEVKQGGDLVEMGKGSQIGISPELQQLISAQAQTQAPQQITIVLEPQAVANTLLKAFNKQQISQLVQLLSTRS
ncbi:histidine kinase [Candidatus Gracilibacteria bacterium]|nr:histidine kinase [Candidatus Gracilibacteria bacterium]NJM85994.1 histidine kinase [Hydrococcus sp. RU_2_2]NJP17649.1 histidine kinase [Hydrococcus sp. CRU_1_1]